MISIIVSFIPYLFALFARQNQSKFLVILASILLCIITNTVILLYNNQSPITISQEFIGGIIGAVLAKSLFGIFAIIVFTYLFRKYLK